MSATSTNMSTTAYPIVRTAPAGKTHFLRVETLDPADIVRASLTLCNVERNNAPVMTQPGVQATCKRCLKIAEINASRENNQRPETIDNKKMVNGVAQTSLPSTAWNVPF